MAMKDPRDGAWQVTCSIDQFGELLGQRGFHQLVALSRLLNALRFVQAAIPDSSPGDAGTARQQVNAFFFLSALVFEGWRLAQRMAKDFRHYVNWDDGFGAILRDREYERFVSQHLKPLRNQSVFHFAEDEVARQLFAPDEDRVIFLSANGHRSVFYELSDMIALRTLMGKKADHENLIETAGPLCEQAGRITTALLRRVTTSLWKRWLDWGLSKSLQKQSSRAAPNKRMDLSIALVLGEVVCS